MRHRRLRCRGACSAATCPQLKGADGVIAALKAAGLPSEGLYPKGVDTVIDEPIDLVVTVCDVARAS